MTAARTIETRLESPTSTWFCFDQAGARAIDPPETLVGAEGLIGDVGGPLDPLAPDSHATAVSVFMRARNRGSATAPVALLDGEERMLYIAQLDNEAGAFIAILDDLDDDAEGSASAELLPVRNFTFEMDATGVITAVDEGFTRYLGWAAEDVVGNASLDIIDPDDHERSINMWVEMLTVPGTETRMRQRLITKAGGRAWVEVTDINNLSDPLRPCVRATAVDISAEMEAQTRLQRREMLLATLTAALPTGVLHIGPDGSTEVCNERWRTITGCDPAGGTEDLLDAITEPTELLRSLSRALTSGANEDVDVEFARENATSHARIRIRPLRAADAAAGLLITADDTTLDQAHRAELESQAKRDALTGLFNRLGIEQRLNSRLVDHDPDDRPLAVLFVDLDKFKPINDQWGHSLGDEVLRAVAERIEELIRPGDDVGRFGGDEFLVALGELPARDDAFAVAKRIEDELPMLAARFRVPVDISASVGVAFAKPGDDFDSLIRRADKAMYAQKPVSLRLNEDQSAES